MGQCTVTMAIHGWPCISCLQQWDIWLIPAHHQDPLLFLLMPVYLRLSRQPIMRYVPHKALSEGVKHHLFRQKNNFDDQILLLWELQDLPLTISVLLIPQPIVNQVLLLMNDISSLDTCTSDLTFLFIQKVKVRNEFDDRREIGDSHSFIQRSQCD